MIPYEDLTRRISSWLYANLTELTQGPHNNPSYFEVEAKVGTIISKSTGHRLKLPVDTETLVNTDMLSGSVTFEPGVESLQHQAYVRYLNACMQQIAGDARGAPQAPTMAHSHTWEKDVFYQGPTKNDNHVRVTVDLKTNQVVNRITKIRIKDLFVHCPGSKFDWRLSLSYEKPVEESQPTDQVVLTREKDRQSFRYMNSRVDLTQVTGSENKSYEIEVELDIKDTMQQIDLARAGEPNEFEDSVRAFIDNLRILVRRGGLDLA
ncbi:CYTH-like domain-containing protein [Dipodascopsis tothii]|uniref:CYTH-like domain-containing protein n=1 Tax=Dipodascopsis tothii TaxID=44089 RepID=UPI0034CE344F